MFWVRGHIVRWKIALWKYCFMSHIPLTHRTCSWYFCSCFYCWISNINWGLIFEISSSNTVFPSPVALSCLYPFSCMRSIHGKRSVFYRLQSTCNRIYNFVRKTLFYYYLLFLTLRGKVRVHFFHYKWVNKAVIRE